MFRQREQIYVGDNKGEKRTGVEECYVLTHPMTMAMAEWEEKLEETYLELAQRVRQNEKVVLVVALFETSADKIKNQIGGGLKEIEVARKIKEIVGKRALVLTADIESVDENDGGIFVEKIKAGLANRGLELNERTRVVVGGESSLSCVKFMAMNLASSLVLEELVELDLAITEAAAMDGVVEGRKLQIVMEKERPSLVGKIVVKDK